MKAIESRPKKAFILLSLLLCFNLSFGQTEFSLYRLHNTLPQANMLNPAFTPNFKLVIGLPVISSTRVSADMDGLSFNDLFTRSGSESLGLDTAGISEKMKEVNHIRLNQSIQLFYLGMTLGKSYVSFGFHEVSDFTIAYPGDLVGWATRGPGHPEYEGRPLNIGSLYGKGLAYTRTSISLGRSFFGDRLRLGARFNYLHGLGMAETTKVSGQLIVGIDSIAVQTGEIQVNTAGIDFFAAHGRTPVDYLNYIVRTKNKGVALDFGATYQITKRLSMSAAVNNIGFINWRDYTRSYRHAPVTYTYRGVDVFDYLNKSVEFSFDGELDSLRGLYRPTETTGEKYKTQFVGKGYAGINYRVFGMNNLNALVSFDLPRDKMNPAISLGYTMQLGKTLNANIGATILHRKIDNIGAGIALKISNFQIFAASDRTQSILYPAKATRADIHAGMNLVFGSLEETLPAFDDDARAKKDKSLEKKRMAAIRSTASTHHADRSTRKPVAGVIAQVARRSEARSKTSPQSVKQQHGGEPTEKRHDIVNRGNHRDDRSFIVVVRTFASRDKAENYSRELRQQGFVNRVGYDSEESAYRVYVYRSRERAEARRIRRSYKKEREFQFSRTWILSIADSEFE